MENPILEFFNVEDFIFQKFVLKCISWPYLIKLYEIKICIGTKTTFEKNVIFLLYFSIVKYIRITTMIGEKGCWQSIFAEEQVVSQLSEHFFKYTTDINVRFTMDKIV